MQKNTAYVLLHECMGYLVILFVYGYVDIQKPQKLNRTIDNQHQKNILIPCFCITSLNYNLYAKDSYAITQQLIVPKYQITARDVDTVSIIIQTDNGTAFVSGAYSIKQSLFTATINSFKATHITIPPASPTYNSDVEASHKLIEHECYAKMTNPTLTRFLQQSAMYLDWCNHTRYNAYKKGSPRTLLQEKHVKNKGRDWMICWENGTEREEVLGKEDKIIGKYIKILINVREKITLHSNANTIVFFIIIPIL